MLEFNVSGMTCASCAQAVTEALTRLDRNADVTVDLDNHRVRVESGSSRAEVSRALEAAGYPVVEKGVTTPRTRGCGCGTERCCS